MNTQDEFIDCKCPHCGHEACFRADVAGLVEECPECTGTLIVPRDGSAVGRILPLPISMPRIVLRRPHPSDWRELLEFLGDPELYTHVDDSPRTEDNIVNWLEADQWVKLTVPGTVFSLAIENAAAKKVIGIVHFNFMRGDRRQGSFTIYINPAFQRQGFGTEALEGLLDFCFNGISVHRVAASCNSENTSAIGLMSKVGMRREGEFLHDHMLDGAWANTIHFALLADEYAKSRSGRD